MQRCLKGMHRKKHSFSRAIVFDLDDTLYLERSYVRSGFEAVSHWAERNLALGDLFDAMWKAFEEGQRGRIFDMTLLSHGVPPKPELIDRMVQEYRSHQPAIALEPDVISWLDQVPEGHGLALITDGFRDSQERKVAALGLDKLGFDPIIVTDVWGRECWKPHERAYLAIQRHFGLEGPNLVYVADNPIKDFIAPKSLGWGTVQISRPDGIHGRPAPSEAHAAAHEISSFADLPIALAALHRSQQGGTPVCR
jgi:putative hydrolase of the HAD superfamily